MKINNASFLISAVKESQYPEGDLPEFAFVGRSNIGKSSLINTLLGRKNLAKTSSTPGKTRTINFYEVTSDRGLFRFVDLPGYGFASVSKSEKESWKTFIDSYLTKRKNLVGILQLVDIRHAPSKEDMMMHEWIQYDGIPALLVMTKADKLSKNQRVKPVRQIKEKLKLKKEQKAVAFSKMSEEGKEEIIEWLSSFLEAEKEENESQTK